MSRKSLPVLLALLTTTACAPLDDDFVTDELGNEIVLDDILGATDVRFTPPLVELPELPNFNTVVEGEDEVIVPCRDTTLDFDVRPGGRVLLAGEDMTNVYAALGVTISTFNYAGTSASTGISFDSENPTGGDFDLGTPNAAFGGPGIGDGGADTNDTALGNVLIRAENTVDGDDDGRVDEPDDHAHGARFVIDFRKDTCIDRADLVDVESRERPAEFVMFDGDGVEIASYVGGGLGNNSVEELSMGDCGIRQLVVRLRGSGAIDNLEVCLPPIPNTEL